MSSSINKNVNVDRRTWDKETYAARARSRAAAEVDDNLSHDPHHLPTSSGEGGGSGGAEIKNQIDPAEEKEEFLPAQQGRAGPMGSKRAFLKSRTQKVDLEGKLGTTEIIDPAAASATKSNLSDNDVLKPSSGVTKCSDGVGWHCRVCDCFLKDSLTYLDHINGRKHQRYLGYTMRVEKSTTEEVSSILKGLADKKRERDGNNAITAPIDFEDVVRQKDEEALKRKAERARKREDRKRREKGEAQEVMEQNETTDAGENRSAGDDDAGENPAEGDDDEEVEEEGMHPDLAAMMGFSGFSGGRK